MSANVDGFDLTILSKGGHGANPDSCVDPIVVGNEITYGLGLGVALVMERLELVFETYGAVPLISEAERATPLETLLALRVFLVGTSFFTIGATRGWLQAAGDPNVRLFAGIMFEPSVGDRDGDGIPDDVDRCPDEPEDKDGFEDQDGCPDPDNDQDGIPDDRDRCPNDPEDTDGWQDEDGCPDPDNDDDGILDLDDSCPNEPENYNGIDDEDGCPDKQRKVVITGGKLEILEKVYFETNKAVIKTESYAILYEVAETLRQNPHIELVEVQGHTDSRGAADYNRELSDKRAAEVRRFLIEEGSIDGARLLSRGYGEDQPVDPSETEAAWAQNRRVEFIIKKESPR
jgi:outer membrane protein OmpA-like peptidoglycan-associated protein